MGQAVVTRGLGRPSGSTAFVRTRGWPLREISAINADVVELVIRMVRKLQEYGPLGSVLPKYSPERKHFYEWLHRVISIVNECLGVRDVSSVDNVSSSHKLFHPTLVERPPLLVLREQTFVWSRVIAASFALASVVETEKEWRRYRMAALPENGEEDALCTRQIRQRKDRGIGALTRRRWPDR